NVAADILDIRLRRPAVVLAPAVRDAGSGGCRGDEVDQYGSGRGSTNREPQSRPGRLVAPPRHRPREEREPEGERQEPRHLGVVTELLADALDAHGRQPPHPDERCVPREADAPEDPRAPRAPLAVDAVADD